MLAILVLTKADKCCLRSFLFSILHLPFLELNPPTSRTAVSRLKCDQLIYLLNFTGYVSQYRGK